MNHWHEMVIQDEIVMCGAVFFLGLVAGGAARILAALRQPPVA